jgi:predicted nuclease of restriction endonuclease-like (RecB) superfamily
MKIATTQEYKSFLSAIKERIYKSQYQALKKVNIELIDLYWSIGEDIVEKQKKLGWGKSVVEILSKDLQKEFPGVHGFSSANLWRMRKFFLAYNQSKKLAPMVREIGWSHNIAIFEKCKNDLEKEFYIRMTKKYGWSKNVLINYIEGKSYERYLINQTNFDKTLDKDYSQQAKLAVKDTYNFDFLELGEAHLEREFELGLVNSIRIFLLEMGSEYAFIGNQFKVEVDESEFFIDLLLYHRKLNCLVAIELKVTEFKPEYAGKMQFYLAALDEKVKQEHENPTIGIIICKTKQRTIVEYTLKQTNSPMGVAEYSLSKKLPKELKGLLPSPEEIAKSLSYIEGDMK